MIEIATAIVGIGVSLATIFSLVYGVIDKAKSKPKPPVVPAPKYVAVPERWPTVRTRAMRWPLDPPKR